MNATKAAAEKLVPEIVSRRTEIEESRRLPKDLNDKLVKSELFRLVVPKEIGGLEVTPWEYVETLEVLSEADASTGWCTMIAASTCLKSAFLEKDIAEAIYGNPLAIHGGVFAPNGRAETDGDSYIVNGDWQWASEPQKPNSAMTGTSMVCAEPAAAQ